MTEALHVERVEDYTDREEHQLRWFGAKPVGVTLLLTERERDAIADIESLTRLPMQLIEKYAKLAVRHAVLKQVEDGEWFATIPGFRGVWAKGATQEQALETLLEVVVDWAVLKIQHQDRDLPELDEINLNVL